MEVAKTIFVVDDDEDDRMLIGEALRNLAGTFKVVEVPSGSDMYALLNKEEEQHGSRLILLDMNMPRMDGLEFLKLLKRNTKWRSVPVIMLSTSSHPDLIRQAYRSGVNVFVVKPVSFSEFEWMARMVNDCFINNSVQEGSALSWKQLEWKNILVVEDNDDHWKLMKLSLNKVLRMQISLGRRVKGM